jgi:hypothetical protein
MEKERVDYKIKGCRPHNIITDDISHLNKKIIEKEQKCSYIYNTFPLIFKNLHVKLTDHLLLGDHSKKISSGFDTPQNSYREITSDEKKEIVLTDPKFGMFSLFKYHINRGYLNNELKKSNKILCSHIFSLTLALPIIIFISQWMLYIALLSYEGRAFSGEFCPNKSTMEDKLMMCGIGLIYLVRSFFIWDNLTMRIGLKKMNRVDNVCAILDTFQEFLFNIIVYGANLWIIFAEDDLQNMILNSLAMEFLMRLDNEFEELYFQNLPGSADDIYDTVYVTYDENVLLVNKRLETSNCFRCANCILFIPYKLLIITIFCFPLLCLFITIVGPLCK